MEDKEIVDLYWARNEEAVAETEKKYGRYCHYIAYQILASDEEAKEIVNDVFLKVWNTVPPNRPVLLKPYVGMLCRQLALNLYEKQHAKRRGGQVPLVLDELAECIPDGVGWELDERISLRELLHTFLLSLPKKTRNIFVRRYWYASSVSEIAKENGMKESGVAMLLLRTRNKLKRYLEKEGFYL